MGKTYSIIVPMYNVEMYISKCIESVIAQTYPKWELIIVDDGSEDRSLNIAKQYEKKDSRIKVLSRQHGGVSQTRNYGLREAKGDYIMLLDSDDYFSIEHLENCEKILDDDCDMCIINNHVNFTEKEEHKAVLFPVYDSINNLSKKDKLDIVFSLNNRLPAAAVLTVYRRRFLIDNNIRYEEKYHCSEDLDFFLNNILYVKKIFFSNHTFYYYRQDNVRATTKNITSDMLLERLTIYKKWIQVYKNRDIDGFDGNKAAELLKRDMRSSIVLYHKIAKNEKNREKLKAYIYDNRFVWEGKRIQDTFFYNMKCRAVIQRIKNSYFKMKDR